MVPFTQKFLYLMKSTSDKIIDVQDMKEKNSYAMKFIA